MELQNLIRRHTGGTSGVRPLNGLLLGAMSAPSAPIPGLYEPLVVVVAQGAKRIVLADRVFENRANEYLVVPLDLPVASYITEASEDAPFLVPSSRSSPNS